MKKIKLGEKLHRVVSAKYFIYEVKGVLEERGQPTQYQLICEGCSDHSPCEVQVKQIEDGVFEYVKMLNHEDDQYFWHTGTKYYLSSKEAIIGAYQTRKEEVMGQKENFQKQITYCEKQIKDLDEAIEKSSTS